jgi:ABC-type nitrate/sulfonate/bicarbonate transport system permease component
VSLVEGLRAAPEPALDLLRGYGAGRAAAVAKVRLPYALPSLFAAAKVAGPLAVLGAVLSEWLATGEGIGNYMVTAQGTARYTAVWASVVAVTVASVALYGAAGAIEGAVSRHVGGARA